MKRAVLITSVLAVALLSVAISRGFAQSSSQGPTGTIVPRLVKFSAMIPGQSGPVGVSFAIYKGETGGAPLWIETQNVVTNPQGRYTVLLGATAAEGLPADLFSSGEARWLGVQAEGQPEGPRVLLVSVPYALKAADAETLAGKPISAFVLAGDANGKGNDGLNYVNPYALRNANDAIVNSTSGTAGYLGVFTNGTDLGNSALFQNAMSRVGINTTSPLDTMHVKFTDTSGAYTGYAVQNMGSGAASYSGMLFYDQNGNLGQFQGFNNSTHEYRINNMTPNGSINFLINSIPKFYVASSGNIGIGTTTPAQKLSVVGTIESTSNGFKFPDGTVQTTAAGSGGGVTSVTAGDASITVGGTTVSPTVRVASVDAAKITGSIPVAQVAGAATTAANVFAGQQWIDGRLIVASPTSDAIYGYTSSPGTFGVYGQNQVGTDIYSAGVKAESLVGGGNGLIATAVQPGGWGIWVDGDDRAIFATAVGSGGAGVDTFGDTGLISQGTSGPGADVSSDTFIGVLARNYNLDWPAFIATGNAPVGSAVASDSSLPPWAALFEGDTHLDGWTFTSGTAFHSADGFQISHPLDNTRYLAHAGVHSPEMLNVYSGTVILDGSGSASVALPSYFEALNADFRYQLTAIGTAMPDLHVATEVAGNVFSIGGGVAGGKVSWQVTGVRQDAYALANPIEVEPAYFSIASTSKAISGGTRQTRTINKAVVLQRLSKTQASAGSTQSSRAAQKATRLKRKQ